MQACGEPQLDPPLRVAVVYYSSTGNVHAMASALADGAGAAGAEVRLRRVAELAPEEAIAANERWVAHRAATAEVPEADVADLSWAEAIAFGSPTRFGGPAAQLKQFIDRCGGLWAKGELADKLCTSFTTASTGHGGLESTLLAINNVFYHWGSLVMPLGYGHPKLAELGNPYGGSWVSRKSAPPSELTLEACNLQGQRLATLGSCLAPRLRAKP